MHKNLLTSSDSQSATLAKMKKPMGKNRKAMLTKTRLKMVLEHDLLKPDLRTTQNILLAIYDESHELN